MNTVGVTLDPCIFDKYAYVPRPRSPVLYCGGTCARMPAGSDKPYVSIPSRNFHGHHAPQILSRISLNTGLFIRSMLSSVDYAPGICELPTGNINAGGNFRYAVKAVALGSTQPRARFVDPEAVHPSVEDGGLPGAKNGPICRIADARLTKSRVGGDLPYVHSRHQATAYAARRGASVVVLMVFIDTLKILLISMLLHGPPYLSWVMGHCHLLIAVRRATFVFPGDLNPTLFDEEPGKRLL